MIKYGFQADVRARPFHEEVAFAEDQGFHFLQLWYDQHGLAAHSSGNSAAAIVRKSGFPAIIHAVLQPRDFKKHLPLLLDLLDELGHQELIIHPVNDKNNPNNNSVDLLDQNVSYALDILAKHGKRLYLECTSKIDIVFQSAADIRLILEHNPQAELLIDLAHIAGYEYLREIVAVKKSQLLHVADRDLSTVHDHLPIGEGNIDFRMIFRDILPDYSGRIIFELLSDDARKNAKRHFEQLLRH